MSEEATTPTPQATNPTPAAPANPAPAPVAQPTPTAPAPQASSFAETTADKPAAATPAAASSSAEATEDKPTAQKIGFVDRLKLIKKKAEYVNGQKMEPLAAEEQARQDLNLPALTEAEKTKAGEKNIFEKALALVGLDKKLTARTEEKPAAPEAAPQDPASASAEATADKSEDKPAAPEVQQDAVQLSADQAPSGPNPVAPQSAATDPVSQVPQQN